MAARMLRRPTPHNGTLIPVGAGGDDAPGKNPYAPPLRVDVKFPILGFLMESEMTGYDLKRRFSEALGFFYRVSDGSLYPALKSLARDALVTMRSEQHGRRARKVYAITRLGRERFMRMLREPAQPVFVIDEAQVKIYFAHHDPGAGFEHIEQMRRAEETAAQMLRPLLVQMEQNGEGPFRRAVVEMMRVVVEARARLLASLKTQLRRQNEVGSHGAGRGRRLQSAGAAR